MELSHGTQHTARKEQRHSNEIEVRLMGLMDVVRDDRIRRLIYDAICMARERFASTDGRDPQLVVKATQEELVAVLQDHDFFPGWILSYHYEGEDDTLVRFYADPYNHSEYPYRQDHLRLFVDEYEDGIGVSAHSEANAVVHRDAHLDEVGLDHYLGATRLGEILKTEEIPHRWLGEHASGGA